ncbi:hypothetical protein B1757_13310 [Acidithiobacillus marinus]|uniref:HD domain-containing protein n=1 Tax=Acidithiobacillus marinus TaxID=187490 RepID=A0A2I1DIS3_9PROT|nr:hypothetical protein [Acidithiobacillus marinus]PKY09773.1 hypothetical protein B1757_13310 [Acidithiobacillus marinus]
MFRIFWVFWVAIVAVVVGLWILAPLHYIEYVTVLSGAGNANAVVKTIGMNQSIGTITWIVTDFFHGAFIAAPIALAGFVSAYSLYRYAQRVENNEVSSRQSSVFDRVGGDDSDYVATELRFHGIKTAYDMSDQSIKLRKAKGHIKTPEWATDYEQELLGILYEHRDWPTDVSGYHGSNLYQHSIEVWKHTARSLKRNNFDQNTPTAQVTRCLALTHDAGKIIAYRQKNGAWIKTSNRHEQLGLVVMRSISAFWRIDMETRKALEKSAAILLNGDNPVVTGVVVDTAVKLVRVADMFVTGRESTNQRSKVSERERQEGSAPSFNAPDQAGIIAIDEQILARIMESSIETLMEKLKIGKKSGSKKAQINNGYKDMVFVDAVTFASHMIEAAENAGVMGLDKPSGEMLNSDAKMILRSMTKEGLLITKIKGKETGDLGLFSYKTSKTTLYNVVCIEWKWPQYIVDIQNEIVVECAIKPV